MRLRLLFSRAAARPFLFFVQEESATIQTINAYLSDYILVFLLIGVGLWYTIRTRFVQVRCFGEGMRKLFGNLSLRGGQA